LFRKTARAEKWRKSARNLLVSFVARDLARTVHPHPPYCRTNTLFGRCRLFQGASFRNDHIVFPKRLRPAPAFRAGPYAIIAVAAHVAAQDFLAGVVPGLDLG
jgi:hypothetical protein